jgi:hypothetical protein
MFKPIPIERCYQQNFLHLKELSHAYEYQEEPSWRNATPEALLRDQVRLSYWKAVISGNQKKIVSTLKAWSDLLHVKRTRKTK